MAIAQAIPADYVQDFHAAYDELIATLVWERNRYLKCAEQLAAEHDNEKAIRVLKSQADYIREQAIR